MRTGEEWRHRAVRLLGEDLASELVRWYDQDPDPATRAELVALVETDDDAGLRDRFGARLEFGTAGLRGELGVGPNRMNRVLVRQAAAGLAAHVGPGSTVVVGFDARHGSADFAADTTRVLAAAGVGSVLLPGPGPTPLVPFAVGHLGASAGVMVTASHNPPRDNGYKVYLADGAQIVPPVDVEVAARIATAAADAVPLAPADHDLIDHAGDEIIDAYLDVVARCRLVPDSPGVGFVYTAMHGVGRDLFLAAVARVGLPAPVLVAEQVDPDPDFPTVAFPNPEEPGALDLALAEADRAGVDLVVAHDPDADRLGVAVRGPHGWRPLTGNEIGALLGDHVLSHTSGHDRVVATTVVSSRLLSRIAEAAGSRYEETLTGFKWIARAADTGGGRLVFAYEEALGYAVTPEVRDKDGITAAVAFVELVGILAAEGRTVLDRLDDLAVAHGLHQTDTWAVRFDGPDATERRTEVMSRARGAWPDRVAGMEVSAAVDLADGGDLPPTDAVAIDLAGGGRVVIRPSGTEPKIKLYLEVVRPTGRDRIAADRSAALDLLTSLRADLADVLGLPVS